MAAGHPDFAALLGEVTEQLRLEHQREVDALSARIHDLNDSLALFDSSPRPSCGPLAEVRCPILPSAPSPPATPNAVLLRSGRRDTPAALTLDLDDQFGMKAGAASPGGQEPEYSMEFESGGSDGAGACEFVEAQVSLSSSNKFRKAATGVRFTHRLRDLVGKNAESLSRNGSKEKGFPNNLETMSVNTTNSTMSRLEIHTVWTSPAETFKKLKSKQRDQMSGDFERHNSGCDSVMFGSGSETPKSYQHLRSGDLIKDTSCMQRCVMKPSSIRCTAWDILTATTIGYDMVMIPLTAFDPFPESLLRRLDLTTASIWVLDIVLSFFRGFMDNEQGIVEMRPGRIARKYLRTWFLLDIPLVVLDGFLLWIESTDWLKFITFLRILRMLRLLRVFRIIKVAARLLMLKEFRETFKTDNYSEKLSSIMSIGKLLAMLVVICHFMACGWYAVGFLGQSKDTHWVEEYLSEEHNVGFRYTTAFHWSLTQFTPASMEVHAVNTAERVYSIFAIFVGLVMFSSVVSSMTQGMTQLRQLKLEEMKQNLAVRRFISENRVSIELASSILLSIRNNKTKQRRRLHEKDIPAFRTLPLSLMMRLHEEVYAPSLHSHYMFKQLHEQDFSLFCNICHQAMSVLELSGGDDVFHYGVRGSKFYFLNTGTLAYSIGHGTGGVVTLTTGHRISEPVLWSIWDHRGRLSGESARSTVVQMDAPIFCRMAATSCSYANFKKYAQLFTVRAARDSGGATLVTDLWGNGADVENITRIAFAEQHEVNPMQKYAFGMRDIDLMEQTFSAWQELTSTVVARRRASRCGAGFCCVLHQLRKRSASKQ